MSTMSRWRAVLSLSLTLAAIGIPGEEVHAQAGGGGGSGGSGGAGGAAPVTCTFSGAINLSTLDAKHRFLGPAGSKAGSALGAAGDVNDDGFGDFLVGAPDGGSSRGYTYLFHGSGAVDLGAPWFARFDGEATTQRSGSALAGGDLLGDGRSDLVLGTPNYTSGGVSSRGAAYIIDGAGIAAGTAALSATFTARIQGEASLDYAGYSVDAAGDLDGDGHLDLIIGAYAVDNAGNANVGATYVLYGPVSSGTIHLSAASAKLIGEGVGDLSGITVAAAGDLDGDGFDDLLVGARNQDPGGKTNAGAVYVLYGGATRWSGTKSLSTADARLAGESFNDAAGAAVARAGDVDGDGLADFVVGAPGASTAPGTAYLIHGSATRLTSTSLGVFARFVGESANNQAGLAVAGGGDINGDGFADVLIGAPNRGGTGAAYVLYGSSTKKTGSSALAALPRIDGEAAGNRAGAALAGAGDVNQDGRDDFLIGAPGYGSNAGAAYLILSHGPLSFYPDQDGDSHGDPAGLVQSCAKPGGSWVQVGDDCDDQSAAVQPGATEICDGIDNDCDGLLDDDDGGVTGQSTWYFDGDADGFGDLYSSTVACSSPGPDWVSDDNDCDDYDAAVYPGAPEICDNIDNDCDPEIDDLDPDVVGQPLWYLDADSDGFGDPFSSTLACFQPSPEWIADDNDCDDYETGVHPGAPEVCDGIDNDCDLLDDDADPEVLGQSTWYADLDGDGFGDPGSPSLACFDPGPSHVADSTDCDDLSAAVNPAAQELCNAIDDDCDALADDVDPSVAGQVPWYADLDGDGFGDPASVTLACFDPGPAHVADSTDCDDLSAAVNPAAQELCNAIDDNCDTLADDADPTTIGKLAWYEDGDGDGFGNAAVSTLSCDAPGAQWTLDDSDCDDLSAAVSPAAQEVCNTVDDDCDALVDDADPSTDWLTWHFDGDADGFGDADGAPTPPIQVCVPPSGYVDNADDCDDDDDHVNPDAPEVCNGADDDCDGAIDTGDTVWFADADQDGFGSDTLFAPIHAACNAQPPGYTDAWGDCNDLNGTVHPGAAEQCNNVDDNCNGDVDDGAGPLWYLDADGDGYGVPGAPVQACAAPPGHAGNDDDCNDADPAVRPGAAEQCNGADDNCNGSVDEGAATTFCADADGDGYGNPAVTHSGCSAPPGYTAQCSDCDDTAADVNPGVVWYIDKDSDGYGSDAPPFASTASCTQPPGYVRNNDDCDDLEAAVNPETLWYLDADGDGSGDPAVQVASCTPPPGHVASGDDCDDSVAGTRPGAAEQCDGIDNDCDGSVDEDPAANPAVWYVDGDGDGHGSQGSSTTACAAPPGFVASSDDCDDTTAAAHPGAAEACDGVDNDCDGVIDDGVTSAFHADFDGDGFGNPDPTFSVQACAAPSGYVADATDCDDGRATANPGGVEVCDNVDNDCDGSVDEGVGSTWYADADGDGHGDPASTITACAAPAGYVAGAADCDDTESLVHPWPQPFEVCDGLDNDCNGTVDDGYAVDTTHWYADADGDGFGDPQVTISACAQPPGHVDDASDCDDTDVLVNPGAVEICNGGVEIDNDCDGDVNDAPGAPWWYSDIDDDGYGSTYYQLQSCVDPALRADVVGNYVLGDHTDCNDVNSGVNPGATEICDNRDQDCDGLVDEGIPTTVWYRDLDGDGCGDPNAPTVTSCQQPGGSSCGPGINYVPNGSDPSDSDPNDC